MQKNNPFNFLKDKNDLLYNQFTESWKNYKTDFLSANDRLRTGIIKFAETVIEEDTNVNKEKLNGNIDKINYLINKKIIPNNKDYVDLIRKRNTFEYGNKIKIIQEDIERYKRVMDIFYETLYKRYEGKQPNDKLNFYYFPINSYQIITYKEIEFLSKKHIEYLAIKENQYGIKQKCIIREYSKKEITLFTHEQSVTLLLRTDIKEEAKNLMKVVEIETKESNLYNYIGYVIDENMNNLQDIELKKLNINQKILLIKDVVNGLYELGNLTKFKINHRNINPQNIYVVENGGNYVAKLGNFDFSKIEMSKEKYQSAYKYIKKQNQQDNFSSYYPKTGWEKCRTYEDWEKVDVYSLGKIIEFICFNKVIKDKYKLEEFKLNGYPLKLGEIYLKMVSQIANNRPTIREIKEDMQNVNGGKIFWKKITL